MLFSYGAGLDGSFKPDYEKEIVKWVSGRVDCAQYCKINFDGTKLFA